MVMVSRDISSLPCPKCSGKLKVTDSRPNEMWGSPSIRRKRVCLDCDHRFSTYEISLDALHSFAAKLNSIGREIVTGMNGHIARKPKNRPLVTTGQRVPASEGSR
jgi:hypothetical protein